ncbi:MAG: ATP-binding protein [Firmicutes bacterium]|nr:ATP-binding protein [Bacillota bacterium]
MGIPVLILGESGTGKSASMRNFVPGSVFIVNVNKKPLPFRSKGHMLYPSDDYMAIEEKITKAVGHGIRAVVIDDAQYLMANEYMRTAKVQGYQKFTDLALNFWSLVQFCVGLPKDVVIYFLSHIERDAAGNEKCKTIGKLLDEKITIEGMFTIVLKTAVQDGRYSFRTQNSGADTVKSPMGMFETPEIDNDLAAVDSIIREYYELPALEAPTKKEETA